MEHIGWSDLITAMVAFLSASAGFWSVLRNRVKVTDEQRRLMVAMLMGLAQQKIICLGLEYIDRGWVSSDEYQDLKDYLFKPYQDLGGNGTAERVMHAVERLPFRDESQLSKIASMPIRDSDLAQGLREASSDQHYEGEDRRGSGTGGY